MDIISTMKVMFIQRLYGLGDKQIEYQILDRMRFRESLDIKSLDNVPDEKSGEIQGTLLGGTPLRLYGADNV